VNRIFAASSETNLLLKQMHWKHSNDIQIIYSFPRLMRILNWYINIFKPVKKFGFYGRRTGSIPNQTFSRLFLNILYTRVYASDVEKLCLICINLYIITRSCKYYKYCSFNITFKWYYSTFIHIMMLMLYLIDFALQEKLTVIFAA
jgi:hypothetical protein